jgi:uncharacterized membrane protein
MNGAYTSSDVEDSMHGTIVPSQPSLTAPIWQRIALASLFFVNASLSLWADGFHRFQWLPWFCLGLVTVIFSEKHIRQKGEPFLAFLKRPRSIVAYALLVCAVVGLAHNIYLIYIKHFG